MPLSKGQKKLTHEAIQYYLSLGNNYKDLVKGIEAYIDDTLNTVDDYNNWLLKEILLMLESKGVSADMLHRYKQLLDDLVYQDNNVDLQIQGQSNLLPAKWVDMGKALLGKCVPEWNTQAIWDFNAGVGELVGGIDTSTLFLSTTSKEDIAFLKTFKNKAKVFKMDFLQDIGEWGDKRDTFMEGLPTSLRDIAEHNKGITLFIKPYATGVGANAIKCSGLTESMRYHKFGELTRYPLYQYMFRVLELRGMLGAWYGHKPPKMTICLFGDKDMFTARWSKPLRDVWLKHFKFVGGISLDKADCDDYITKADRTCSVWVTKYRPPLTALNELPLTFTKVVCEDGKLHKRGEVVL